MAAWSRPQLRPFRLDARAPCAALHPWTDSCALNALGMGMKSFKGGTNFFLLIYLLPLLLKLRSGITRDDVIHQLTCYIRSCLFGCFCGGVSIGVLCLFRNLRGIHTVTSAGFIPGVAGGAGVFLEHPVRRRLDATLFISLVLDLYMKVLVSAGIIKMNLWKELIIFSSSSTLLLYCLRALPHSMTVMWPFPPHKLHPDPQRREHCPHNGECIASVSTAGKTYFFYGLVLQILRVAVVNRHLIFSKPLIFIKEFFKLRNLRLPLFSGLYITIFKGISCLLVRGRGRDEAWHSIPAGVIASLCYLIQPNFSLALVAFGNACQIISRKYKEDLKLPNYPWEEMIFMICMGLLYHARAVYPQCFPSYMFTVMDTVTDGRAKEVYGLVEKHIVKRY